MVYHEEEMDLLSVPQGYFIAHCISADFALGAGVAKQIEDAFCMRKMLFKLCGGDGIKFFSRYGPSCIPCSNVYNLITKCRHWEKPTLRTLETTLVDMRENAIDTGVSKIAMPMIGCGLDKLVWDDVKALIQRVFEPTDIEIMVCLWRKNGNKT